MSNLSNELFFNVHRGLREPLDKSRGLGIHWSADYGVARRFSRDKTVLHAQVPVSSVETDFKKLKQQGVDLNSTQVLPEQEVSLKKGAPVRLTGITVWKRKKNDLTGMTPEIKRIRKFNPPREMQA